MMKRVALLLIFCTLGSAVWAAESGASSGITFEQLHELAKQAEAANLRAKIAKATQDATGVSTSSNTQSVPLVSRGVSVGAVDPGASFKPADHRPKGDQPVSSSSEFRLVKLLGTEGSWLAEIAVGDNRYEVTNGQYINGWKMGWVNPASRCVTFEQEQYQAPKKQARNKPVIVKPGEVKSIRLVCFYRTTTANADGNGVTTEKTKSGAQ